MYRPLHTLRLALSGVPRVNKALTNRLASEYLWPCGCRGTSADAETLNFDSCLNHRELLSEAPLLRSAVK